MALIGKVAAIGLTTATTAAASLTWVALHQPPAAVQKSRNDSINPTDDITVCVGSDSIMRAPGPRGCNIADRRLVLAHADQKLFQCDDCTAWGDPPPASDTRSGPSDALADLERRADKLRRGESFEVVDATGKVLFSVSPGRVRLNDGDGHMAVQLSATDEGGVVTARSNDDSVIVTVGSSSTHSGLAIADDGIERVDLGRQPAGNYALRIMSATGAMVAGIGESRAGSGTVVAGDAAGHPRASVTADAGGTFSVFTAVGTAVASLRQSKAFNGLLSVGDAGGQEVVKMVINDNRYGVVIAGPVVGFPLVTGSGLPGSYILGCAEGPACTR